MELKPFLISCQYLHERQDESPTSVVVKAQPRAAPTPMTCSQTKSGFEELGAERAHRALGTSGKL